MKKGLLTLGILLVAVVTLTGCGSTKTLTCKSTEAEDGTTETHIYKFEKDSLKTFTLTEEMEAASEEEANAAKTTAETYMKSFEMDGVTTKVEVNGKKVTATIEMSIDKVSDEYKSNIIDKTMEDLKAEETEDGFICE